MQKFRINPLVLAMAAALPLSVQAQETPATDDAIEEIVVSGFRASVAKSLETKRDSAGVVDAITASDIAEFPDNNLAESLQRIPGVAITRSGGEGRNISVRGLSPQYTRIRVNGMETVSTTGGTDATGGNNRLRNFDFNTFSSDLFTSLVVHKTGSAEVDEGSLGATVDMRAARPFDYEGFVLTANGQLGYNDLSKKEDPSGGILISNTFADGKLGALVSYSYAERTIQDEGKSTVRWSNLSTEKFGQVKGLSAGALGANVVGIAPSPNAFDEVNGPCTKPAPTTAVPNPPCSYNSRKFMPRIPRYDSYNTDLSREGLSASFQFRPTDATEITLDALLSKYEATRTEKFLQGSMNGSQNASVNVTDYAIEGNSLVYASMTGARLLAESRQDELTTDFSMYTLSAKHDFTDSFRINGLIGTSESDFQNPIQNTIIMQANNQNLTWDYRGSNEDAYLTFGDGAYDKANWAINSVRQRPQAMVNTYDTAALNLEFDLNDSLTLKGGATLKQFEAETWQKAYLGGEGLGSTTSTTAANNCSLTGNTTVANTPSPSCGVNLQSNPDFITSFDSGLGQGTPWLLPNRSLIMDSYGLWDKPMTINDSSTGRGSTFNVTEDTLSEYIQLDFKTEVAGLPLRGNIGVRHFTTDQESTGWKRNNNVWSQEMVDRSYSDTLPSLNLVLEPIENLQVRAAYSEGIARPNMSQLTDDTNVTVTGTQRQVTVNNPYLKPSKAKSFDLGLEWYFTEEAAISLGVFRKEVDTFVQTVPGFSTYTALGLPVAFAQAACGSNYAVDVCHEDMVWATSEQKNAPGGTINGYEISYQQPFTFLPGFLKNFGFIGSYTHVDAEMDYATTTPGVFQEAPLLNLSPNSSSVTIYFEQDAFKARVSVAQRDGYLTLAVNDANANYQNGTNGTTNVDAQISYQINEHFKVTLDALNLTNEVDDQWVESTEPRLSYYHETGTQYNLGVNYKF
ncbi:MAG: TonB-dependent receptor [Pseudomonadota bacterium]